MAVGLGGEQLWLSPTVANNVNPFDDQSGQGNNGTAQGGLSTITDTSAGGAYCYDFDGTDDYIDVTSSGVPASAYTVSLWQYSTNSGINTAFNAGQVGGERTVNIDGIKAGLSGDNHGHKRGSTSYWAVNPTVRTSATWYHYLLTYDGSELRLYVDGVFVASKAGVPNTDWIEDRCWIGQYIGGSFFFQGRIDDVRTYGRVLTQSERGHLATARGIEGRPFDGLGGEQLWLCPSLEDSPNDISGNNNNGVYQNGMGTVADTSNGGSLAYDFDGLGDYIDTGSTTVHQNTLFTYSFWINASASTSGTDGTAGSYETAGGHRGPLAASISGDNKLTWLYMSLGSAYNPAQLLKSVGDVYDSTWRHVVCEFDGNNNEVKIYIDGTLDSSKTASVPNIVNISTPLKFGAGGGGYTTGRMDDVRVYNRALLQSEITHLATSRGVLGPPGGATHYNPFKSHAFINDFQQRLR